MRTLFISFCIVLTSSLALANDLSISIQSAPDPVYENGIINYSITVSNGGAVTATGVEVVNILPSSVQFNSLGTFNQCLNSLGTVTCNLSDDILAGESFQFDIAATTTTAENVINTASVSANEVDPNTVNNSITHETEIKSTGAFLPGGIKGGSVHRFSYDPNNSNTVYASTIGAGVFKSVDDGNSWSAIYLPTLSGHFVNHVLPSSETANLVLVCSMAPSGASIWRSTDGGLNFNNVLGIQEGACHHIIEGIQANTYFAAVNDGSNGYLFKSTNSGATWVKQPGSINGLYITNLVQIPDGTIIAGTQDAGIGGFTGNNYQGDVFYTADEGASWTEVTSQNFTDAVLGMAYNGSSEIQIVTSDGSNLSIWSSTDQDSWISEITYSSVTNIVKNPIIYDATSDSFYLLADKLAKSGSGSTYTWDANPVDLKASSPNYYSRPQAIIVDPDSANKMLLGLVAGDAVIRTDNGGTNWAVSNEGYFAQFVEIATKDKTTGYRFAGNRNGFVYFSESLLAEWKTIYRSETDIGYITSIVYDQNDNKRVYLPFLDGTILVNNNVISNAEDVEPFPHTFWSELNYTPPAVGASPYAMWVDGSTIFIGFAIPDNASSGNYLYKSTNSGVSWSPVSTLTTTGGVRTLEVHPLDSNVMYAGGGDYDSNQASTFPSATNGGGLYKSIDGGNTWTALNSETQINSGVPQKIVLDPNDLSRLWLLSKPLAGGMEQVWESLDAGATWHEITPSPGYQGFTIAYISSDDVLLATTGSLDANINVTQLKPNSCANPCQWTNAFGVYGEAQVIYSGSAGIGTGAGLYEFATVPKKSSGGGGGGSLQIIYLLILFGFICYGAYRLKDEQNEKNRS